MKLLTALSALLAITSATSEWTCEDCNAVVSTISTYLTGQESIDRQIEILLAEVCPQAENADECVERLPAFWTKIAMVLWPGYWDQDAEWMCAQEGLCGAPGSSAITCEECLDGIQQAIEQLLAEEYVAGIVNALSGDGFCGMEEDPELCASTIAALIPMALPALAGVFAPEQANAVCNTAIPDTCPSY